MNRAQSDRPSFLDWVTDRDLDEHEAMPWHLLAVVFTIAGVLTAVLVLLAWVYPWGLLLLPVLLFAWCARWTVRLWAEWKGDA